MILLKINQPGLVLSLNQMRKQVRTPAELDVTCKNIDRIIKELRNEGVNDFELKTVSDIEYKQQETKKTSRKSDSRIHDNQEEKITIVDNSPCDQVSNRLERITEKIEFVVDRLSDKIDRIQDSKPEKEELKSTKPSKKFEPEEADDEFIPSINLDGLEKHGDNSHKEIESDKNTDKADSLSKKLGNKE